MLHYNVEKLPYNSALKQTARELRKAGNLAEILLWSRIKNRQFIGLDFTRQQIIGNYIADFFCAKLRTVIEIDGTSHTGRENYDANRDFVMHKLGIKVIRISDSDVKRDLDGVLEHLGNIIYQ